MKRLAAEGEFFGIQSGLRVYRARRRSIPIAILKATEIEVGAALPGEVITQFETTDER